MGSSHKNKGKKGLNGNTIPPTPLDQNKQDTSESVEKTDDGVVEETEETSTEKESTNVSTEQNNSSDNQTEIKPAGQTISVACDPGSDAASQISIALLNQKPVQSGAPLIEVLGPTETPAKQETPTNINLEKFDAVINQLADEFLNMRKECESVPTSKLEPVPNTMPEPEYMWNPDPAWGYIGAAAGGAGLLFLLTKLFGGK